MTAKAGTLVLIKVGDGGSPENFATVGGLRASQITLNNRAMDASNLESGVWRQLLTNAGIRMMTISGNGIFTDSPSEETMRGYAFAGTINNYRFIFSNGNNLTGPFQVTGYERTGPYDAEESYAMTLESAGVISFAVS